MLYFGLGVFICINGSVVKPYYIYIYIYIHSINIHIFNGPRYSQFTNIFIFEMCDVNFSQSWNRWNLGQLKIWNCIYKFNIYNRPIFNHHKYIFLEMYILSLLLLFILILKSWRWMGLLFCTNSDFKSVGWNNAELDVW